MSATDKMRVLQAIEARPPTTLVVSWSDGTHAELDLKATLDDPAFGALRDPAIFAQARLGEWGHSVEWPSGLDLGADMLWLATLSATGRADAREFLEWRLRHGLSLSGTAEALGLSRRMVAYYSNGERRVPKSILLACKGWESSQAA